MSSNEKLLDIKDLVVHYETEDAVIEAVNNVSFEVKRGEILGIVGETGAGKTTIGLSIMGLLPKPPANVIQGSIKFNGRELLPKTPVPASAVDLVARRRRRREENKLKRMHRTIRGRKMTMMFQDPMTALNPVYTVGFQIREAFMYHAKMAKAAMQAKAVELLRAMRIPAPEQRVNEYIHQYSGGMRQRAMIAMAMACNPKILIADEPTTALDVTVQAQIFDLMNDLQQKHNAAILLITHDMGVVAELAHDVVVMYMGVAVENGPVEDVLTRPAHPYTSALLRSIPVLGQSKAQKLEPIRGSTPDPFNRPQGCQFHPRCDFATEQCLQEPETFSVSPNHTVRCWHYEKVLANA